MKMFFLSMYMMLASISAAHAEEDWVTELRDYVAKCWKKNPNISKATVLIKVTLAADGSFETIGLGQDDARLAKSDANYAEHAAFLIEALKNCEPFDFLPSAQYDRWKEMELAFDPSVTREAIMRHIQQKQTKP